MTASAHARLVHVLALFCAVAAHAQTTATLQGRVFDPTGAVLPDASITLRSDSIGIDRSVATDDAGQYHIAQIPPGHIPLRPLRQVSSPSSSRR
jgi:protocatechuate 3,4-dioxygenase beta subunit